MTLQKHLVYTHFLFEEMVPERVLQKAQLFLSAVLDVTNVVEHVSGHWRVLQRIQT